MVKQGDIILVDFNPKLGHEQAGYIPALVISNDFFNSKTNLAIVCPITSTNNAFPLHISLDNRTSTKGFILCEHLESLDLTARKHKVVEQIPNDILEEIISTVFSEIETT